MSDAQSPSQIVTRFAPSPTGYLHIGGARTALFNWAYAKGRGGKFLLRIEDTDRERSTEDAITAIFQGLEWLGLQADDEPVRQSARQARHMEVVAQLLEAGHAYRSKACADEIEAIRQSAREAGVAARYPGRDGSFADLDEGDYVVRFKAPDSGETVIRDQVQGDVTIRNDQLDDLVLLRSDGSPTYMLAVVVDDHDMGVTHVIRGDDHLTNCARQIQIYDALEWALPVFAHIPLIHGADGAKLSKRHGALGAEQYQLMGYLPEAMRNYLARLGWAHGDDEFITTAQLIEWFDFDGMNKAPSRFDLAKLDHINGHYIRQSDDDALAEELACLLQLDAFGAELTYDKALVDLDRMKPALSFLKERAKTLVELLNAASYLFVAKPSQPDEKCEKALQGEEVKATLGGIKACLEEISSWDKETIEAALKAYCTENDLKFGKIGPPLRAVLTGTMTSPGIYDVLSSLGQSEALSRIDLFLGNK